MAADVPWLWAERMHNHDTGCSIGVIGAGGGAGASVLAAVLATRAARAGHETVLVDLAPHGGGIDVLLGCEHEPGPRWHDLAGADGRVDAEALLPRLPRSTDGVALLSYGRGWVDVPDRAVRAVCGPLAEAAHVTVHDLGPQPPDWADELDAVLLVTPGRVPALAAAQVLTDRLLRLGARPWLVPRGIDDATLPLVAEALDLPVLEPLPHEPRVADDVDAGVTPGERERSPLAATADRVLRRLLVERDVA